MEGRRGGSRVPLPYKLDGDAYRIPDYERDRVLLSSSWPDGAVAQAEAERWIVQDGNPRRRLTVYNEGEDPQRTRVDLWEAMLRFPNAAIYGTHRALDSEFRLERERDSWPNIHTMRVLGRHSGRASDPLGPENRVRHVYLLHNGLNETRDLAFHYRLAAWILKQNKDAVCIIRPLPGHLTRHPYGGPLNALPLDDYLRDPLDLFRQFLRYMVETQWLLTAIMPRPRYDVVAGAPLLAEYRSRSDQGRRTFGGAGDAIYEAWDRVFKASTAGEDAAGRPFSKIEVERRQVKEMVRDLRRLLKWSPSNVSARSNIGDPHVHVVGYSMGGFMAQSCFFAWPYAIGSCTNLFAGGALRDLAPTAFAHREEWQAVLHALRYELDDALSEFLAPRGRRKEVVGIDKKAFEYFKRIFYEVFLQYYRGGYSSRVEEFSRRLLFVVGGDDPIVRTENVLDAGPPEGMTLLQLADVSHFPGPTGASRKPDRRDVAEAQRTFWLPQIGRIIADFSERAETTLDEVLVKSSPVPADWAGTGGGTPTEEGMGNWAFLRELDRLLKVVEDGKGEGWLLVSRNEVPPVFLDDAGFRLHARALHHSEDLIQRYMLVMDQRRERIAKLHDRLTLLIPDQSAQWFQIEHTRRKLFSKSETPGGAEIPPEPVRRRMWRKFAHDWGSSTWLVRSGEYEPGALADIGPAEADRNELRKIAITIQPDIWIAFSPRVFKNRWGADDREGVQQAMVQRAAALARRDPVAEEDLRKWIANGEIAGVRVSSAELNPRYRGQRLQRFDELSRAFRHWALAYQAATPMIEPPGA